MMDAMITEDTTIGDLTIGDLTTGDLTTGDLTIGDLIVGKEEWEAIEKIAVIDSSEGIEVIDSSEKIGEGDMVSLEVVVVSTTGIQS